MIFDRDTKLEEKCGEQEVSNGEVDKAKGHLSNDCGSLMTLATD